MSKASKLVNDLTFLPNIVGNMGLSIAAAQKAFNLTYLEAVQQIIVMGRQMLGAETETALEGVESKEKTLAALSELIITLAPVRYQYTETELEFHADLAQSMRTGITAGLGVALGAFTVNASYTTAFGYDYRAAAKVRTVIHADRVGENNFRDLLDRSKEIAGDKLTLPALAEVDGKILDASKEIYNKLVGADPPPVKETEEPKEESDNSE